MAPLETIAILALAFAGDAFFGDPPNRFHPVAWMGSGIAVVRRRTCAGGNGARFMFGLLLLVTGVGVVGTAGWLLERAFRQMPGLVAIAGQAVVLNCMFSVRSLTTAADRVAHALQNGDLPSARHEVAYHLVSRDVTKLDASGVAAATIESVAENTSDSIVAPLFYFALAGLPGVLVYRFVNTCDAMLGYRNKELEWYGKTAARLDDLLNFVPARITAVIMLVCNALSKRGWRRAIGIWWRDHRRTASPNAGHPMSAASGVLGVALEKESQYVLGGEQPKPTVATIRQAVSLAWRTSLVFVLAVSAILVVGAIGR